MATIDVRRDRIGRPQCRARVRRLGSPQHSATFHRKADALQWARQVESDLKRGRYVPTTDAMRRTVADMIDRYLIETLPNERRNRDQANVVKRLGWWKANLGEHRLANVTPALVAEYREKLAREPTRNGPSKNPSTVNRYLAALSHAFTTAVREWGWLTDSPMRNVARREEPGGRTRFLTDSERSRLLDACRASRNKDLHTVVVLALSTGARAGELMHLT